MEQELERLKPVILTGDLNCAHQEIDIYNPAVGDMHFHITAFSHNYVCFPTVNLVVNSFYVMMPRCK